MQKVLVSPNHRFLQTEDGKPFFWLADTAWELFHRLDRGDAEHYLRDRAKKGFTVIQAVILAELDGLNDPNAYGERPLHDNDPAKPNEAYFRHVDWIVAKANSLGITMALLPTWGDKWNKKWGVGPEIFTPKNARAYGKFVAQRYRNASVIWVMGGDRPIESDDHKMIVNEMAAGVREGCGGDQLITYHPMGGQTSSTVFHNEKWLAFNMWQSGHGRNNHNDESTAHDYALTPTKPVIDAEPGYEDHPAGFDLNNGYLDDYDNRKCLYWSLFAGACGHTYGCHPVWQMLTPDRQAITWARRPWHEAIQLPGASQMQFAKRLLLARPYFTRIPDQSLVHGEAKPGCRRVRATRDQEGTYAMIYIPTSDPVEINLARIRSKELDASWYDPRTGVTTRLAPIAAGDGDRGWYRRSGNLVEVRPPSSGPDWVLVLDDPAERYRYP